MVRYLKKIFNSKGWHVEFSRDATNDYLIRAFNDSDFIARKGRITGSLFKVISVLAKIIRFVPHAYLPVIDCRISNTEQIN